ncbi:MAG: hypothetical protein GX053_12405 [Tissierella sp.]|nr:hypothetical protein [Tissierella sp.]
MEELIKVLKDDFYESAVDLSESLELLKEVINSTIDEVSSRVAKEIISRNFDNINKYKDLAEKGSECEILIERMLALLESDDKEIIRDFEEEQLKETNHIPNYDEYQVDNSVEHSLLDNFTHKRPYGFKFIRNDMYEANSWKDIFIKTCEILYDINPDKFKSFEDLPHMNGKKKKYFSSNPKDLRKEYRIRSEIYVETNQSANTIRNIIVKILKEYKFKISDFKIYLRADYTELRK